MRNIWRQSLPYYAYSGIHQLIDTVRTSCTRQQRRMMDLISKPEARLLFRVTNFINPLHILQVGAATGIESVTMLEVKHESRLYLYEPNIEQNPLAVRVLQSQLDRVECYDDVKVAVDEFLEMGNDDESSLLVLVNTPVDDDVIKRLLDAQCIVMMRNLKRDETMQALFDACCHHMTMGQTYTNNKIAILNPNPKLQREDFLLWL